MSKADKQNNPPARRHFKIRTPVADFKGTRHNVRIMDGQGTTDCLADALACRIAGYAVVEIIDGKETPLAAADAK